MTNKHHFLTSERKLTLQVIDRAWCYGERQSISFLCVHMLRSDQSYGKWKSTAFEEGSLSECCDQILIWPHGATDLLQWDTWCIPSIQLRRIDILQYTWKSYNRWGVLKLQYCYRKNHHLSLDRIARQKVPWITISNFMTGPLQHKQNKKYSPVHHSSHCVLRIIRSFWTYPVHICSYNMPPS